MGVVKRWTTALLVLACVLAGAWGWQEHRVNAADRAAFDLATKGQIALSQSTAARLASSELQRDSLAALYKAASQLGGKLVAGVTVTVVKHDTLILHDTLSTTLTHDSTRIAHFRDSTFAGVVSGRVLAPPCCQPLVLDSLAVLRPAFHPEIGFVQLGTHLAATVEWQGESVRLENVFALPLPEGPKRVRAYADYTYGVATSSWLGVGVQLRTFYGVYAGPAALQILAPGQRPLLGLAVHKEW